MMKNYLLFICLDEKKLLAIPDSNNILKNLHQSPRLKKVGKDCSGLSCHWALFTAGAYGFKLHLIFHSRVQKTV